LIYHKILRPTSRPTPGYRFNPPSARGTTGFTETAAVITSNATISVQKVTYSVPSRLIGHRLRIHLYDDRRLA